MRQKTYVFWRERERSLGVHVSVAMASLVFRRRRLWRDVLRFSAGGGGGVDAKNLGLCLVTCITEFDLARKIHM